MMLPSSLPPRPHHTLSLRTVENLYQRHLERTGTHVRPEQIPAFLEDVRNGLARVEEVLRYRLQCPPATSSLSLTTSQGGKERPLLSKFERVRMGKILADIVLDIAIVSIVSSSETSDAAVGTNKSMSLSTSHVGVVSPHSCSTDDVFESHSQEHHQEQYPHGDTGAEAVELPEMGLFPHVSSTDNCSNLCGGGSGEVLVNVLPEPRPTALSESLSKTTFPVFDLLEPMSERLQSHNRIHRVDSHGNSSSGKPAWALSSSQEMQPNQHPMSHVETPLSPSMHFKPVLSMHSGADSSSTCPLPRRRPRKYYDIDLQKVSDFTRCLRRVQQMSFTDGDFEMIGLRYAIPGIRELHPEEVQFLEGIGEQCKPADENPSFRSGEDDFGVKRTISMTSTGGGTEVDACSVFLTCNESNTNIATPSATMAGGIPSFDPETVNPRPFSPPSFAPQWPGDLGTSPNDTGASSAQHFHCKEQCLPLFRGGRDTIVKKKDFNIFLAMVEARLKSVDQEINGQLRTLGADLASSSGEE